MIARSAADRRGGVYIAVLGVSSMITVIGISGVLLAQVERDASEATLSTAAARYDAQSALAVALDRVSDSSSWHTSYPAQTWQTTETFGQGEWSFMLEYDQATATADDAASVTFTALASRDPAARAFSIDAVVASERGANALKGDDADLEASTGAWKAFACALSLDGGKSPSGAASMQVTGRTAAVQGGPGLEVTSLVSSGGVYGFSAYILNKAGKLDEFTVTLLYHDGSKVMQSKFTSSTVGDTWTKITGTLTPDTGGGPLVYALIHIGTVSSTEDFWVDDVRFWDASNDRTIVEVTPGTFRQRVIE